VDRIEAEFQSQDPDDKCPRCGSDDVIVSNIDGLICSHCGCWFDMQDGEVMWAYDHMPAQI